MLDDQPSKASETANHDATFRHKPGAPIHKALDFTAPAKKKRFSFRRLTWPPTRQQIIIGLVVFVFGLAGSATAALLITRKKPTAVTPLIHHVLSVIKQPTSNLVASNLTGLPVDPALNQAPVTGVMIENSTQARPQSGLDQAGVVFEALAEGGITRFLALFQAGSEPDYIGPVRSLRPYFLQWDLGFDAPIAHVGGSLDALNDVNTWQAKDLNQFYNSTAYHRIDSRQAPHNVYTNLAALNKLEQQKGFASSSFSGFTRLKDAKPDPTLAAGSIDIKMSYSDYNDHYDYNKAANVYERFEGGQPHMEMSANGKQTQIAPNVVVAMIVPESNGALDSSGAYYSDYSVIDSGQADIFQNGTATICTWQKLSLSGQITFQTSTGQTVPLDPGQTWITAVSSISAVSYKP